MHQRLSITSENWDRKANFTQSGKMLKKNLFWQNNDIDTVCLRLR